MTKLKDALNVLKVSVERLGNARSILTDEAIGRLGQTVTDTLMKMRNCPSSARLIAPHRTPRGKTAEARASAGSHEN